jgi:hypothetical protein
LTLPDSVSTVVTQQSTVITLESARHSVKVPAGRYKAYVVDESITTSSTTTITTPGGGPPIILTSGPITNTATEYYAPKVGLVEFTVGASNKVELVSFTPKGKA